MSSQPYINHISDPRCSGFTVYRREVNACRHSIGPIDPPADHRSSGLLRECLRIRERRRYQRRLESLHDVRFSPSVTDRTQEPVEEVTRDRSLTLVTQQNQRVAEPRRGTPWAECGCLHKLPAHRSTYHPMSESAKGQIAFADPLDRKALSPSAPRRHSEASNASALFGAKRVRPSLHRTQSKETNLSFLSIAVLSGRLRILFPPVRRWASHAEGPALVRPHGFSDRMVTIPTARTSSSPGIRTPRHL